VRWEVASSVHSRSFHLIHYSTPICADYLCRLKFPPPRGNSLPHTLCRWNNWKYCCCPHEGRNRDWDAGEINARLRSQENSITKWLGALVSLGIAARTENRYRFAPSSEKLAHETAALAETYRERRIKIIELIFSKPNENLLDFIRAFELRKRP
jgi:hypothetical protein